MALKIFVFTNWFQFIGCCLSFSFPFFDQLMAKSTLISDFSYFAAAMQVGGGALVQYWRLLLPVIVGNWAAMLVLNVTFQLIFIGTLAITFLTLNGAGG